MLLSRFPNLILQKLKKSLTQNHDTLHHEFTDTEANVNTKGAQHLFTIGPDS